MKRINITVISLLSAALLLSGAACDMSGLGNLMGGLGASSSDTSSPVPALLDANDLDAVLTMKSNVLASVTVTDNGTIVSSNTQYYAKDEDGHFIYDERSEDTVKTYDGGMIYHVAGDDYAIEFVNPSNYDTYIADAYSAPLKDVSVDAPVETVENNLKVVIADAKSSLELYFNTTTNLLAKTVLSSTSGSHVIVTETLYSYSVAETALAGDSAKAKHAVNDPVAMSVNYILEDSAETSLAEYTVSKASAVIVEDGYGVYKNNLFTCDAEDFTYLYDEDTEVVVYFTEKRAEISFEYTLTEADYDAYMAALTAAKDALLNEGTEDVINENLEIVFDSIDYFKFQYSISQCNYNMDMSNTTVQGEYEYAMDTVYAAIEEYQKLCKELYESDSSWKEDFFEGWTEEDFASLESAGESLELDKQMTQIQDEFELLSQDDPNAWAASMKELYVQYVALAQDYAALNGYDNYYAYAMENVYNRDYTMEDLEDFRAYTKEYLVPILNKMNHEFNVVLESMSDRETRLLSNFLYSDSNGVNTYLKGFINSFDDGLRDRFLSVYEKEAILFGTSANAMQGAYTSYLERYEEAYIYIGNGYDNIATVVHEMGHYASAYTYDFSALNYDFAEVHSQANEWLLTAYMKNRFLPNVYKGLYIYNAYNALINSVISVLVDDFEYTVYTADTPYTVDQLDDVMNGLYAEYGITDGTLTLSVAQNYWKQVVLHSPVYYISYATSQIASMSVFIVAENEGYDVAMEVYRKLQEDGDLAWGFVGNLKAAGLTSPFDEETHIAMKEFFLPSEE